MNDAIANAAVEEKFVFRRIDQPFNLFGWQIAPPAPGYEWQSPWVWVLGAVVLLALVYVIFMYNKDSKGVGIGWALLLGFLRMTVYAILGLVFLLPANRTIIKSVSGAKVITLFDVSDSFQQSDDLPSGDENQKFVTRQDLVLQFLLDKQKNFIGALEERNPTSAYRFGSKADEEYLLFKDGKTFTKAEADSAGRDDEQQGIQGPLPEPYWREWLTLKNGGNDAGLKGEQLARLKKLRALNDKLSLERFTSNTNIGDSLATVLNKELTGRVQGIIVVTDGHNTLGNRAAFRDLAARAKAAKVPIFVVAVGVDRERVRVELGGLRLPKQAQPEDKFPVFVEAIGEGIDGKPLDVAPRGKLSSRTAALEMANVAVARFKAPAAQVLFPKLDRNLDGKLVLLELEHAYFARLAKGGKAKQAREQLALLFKKLDADNNGAVTVEEFVAFFGAGERDKRLKGEAKEFLAAVELILPKAELDGVFADVEKEEVLPIEVVERMNPREPKSPRARIVLRAPGAADLYMHIDADGKKGITPDELLRFLAPRFAKLKEPKSGPDHTRKLFGLLDSNKDGSVSQDEFVGFCREIGTRLRSEPKPFAEAAAALLPKEDLYKIVLPPGAPGVFSKATSPRAELGWQIDAAALAALAGEKLDPLKKWGIGENDERSDMRFIARVPTREREGLRAHYHYSAPAKVKVVRKPIRVLLVASGANRDFQFVQTLLVREMDERKTIDLVIYLQKPPGEELPRTGVVQNVQADRLIKSFPDTFKVKKDFLDLQSYDAIVAYDPDWTQITAQQIKNLKLWAEQGGGLVLVGGYINTVELIRPRERGDTKYEPLLKLLPVVLDDARDFNKRVTDNPWPLDFTSAPPELEFLRIDEDMPARTLFREIDEIDGKRDERVTMDNLKELTKEPPTPKPGEERPAASRKPLPASLVVELFGLLDQDKNRSISEEEFASFCRERERRLQGQPEAFREALNKWLTTELERTDRATFLKDWKAFFYGEDRDSGKPDRGFYNFYPLKKAKPVSQVIARFDDPATIPLSAEKKTQPYIVASAPTEPRVVWIGSAESWRLREYKEVYHERFWTKLVRYAASKSKGSATQAVQVLMSPEYRANEFVDVEVKVESPTGDPLGADIKPQVELKFPPGADPKEINNGKPFDMLPRPGKVRDGWFTSRFRVLSAGEYELTVRVKNMPGAPDGLTATKKFVVKEANPELDNIRPDFDLMYRLASEADMIDNRFPESAKADLGRVRKALKAKPKLKPTDEKDKADLPAGKDRLYFTLDTADLIPLCMEADKQVSETNGPHHDWWDEGFTLWTPKKDKDDGKPPEPVKLSYVLVAVVALLGSEWLIRKLLRLA